MSSLDYQRRLYTNAAANAERWGKQGTGHILLAIGRAKFLPALDRHSPAPRGRIVNLKTGACRVALPGELAEWVRLMAGPVSHHRSILWDAIQKSVWSGEERQ